VIHPNSIPAPREHRRAKTDQLDTRLLMRAFLGWLRGEARHCSMAAIPSLAEEDAKGPSRELEKLGAERTRITNKMKAALIRLGVRLQAESAQGRRTPSRGLRTPEGLPVTAGKPKTIRHLLRSPADM
jgi:transposase